MKQTKSKNWVAVIPSFILYNSELTDKDKLVFAVISNLTHEKGYCWASNRYIGELLNCSSITISRSISRLNELKLINNTIERSEDGTQRKIFLPISKLNMGVVKNEKRVIKKRQVNSIDKSIDKQYLNKSKDLLTWFNNSYKRNFKVINSNKLKQRLKNFGIEQIKEAIRNAHKDQFHVENKFKYLTPEYFLRNDNNIDKWLNTRDNEQTRDNTKTKPTTYTTNIAKEFGW